MERSSDRSCRQRLGEDTGQVHSRRAGVFPAISTGTRWSLLLPGGGARPPTSAWGPRSQDAPGRGLQSTGSSSKVNVGLHRRGVALRHRLRAGAKEACKIQSKAKEGGDRKQRIQQWQQQSGCDRHRPHVGTAQKELARQWYAKRKQKGKGQELIKEAGPAVLSAVEEEGRQRGEPESKLDVTTSLIEATVKAEGPLRGLLALQLAQVAKRKARNPETVEEVARPTPAGVRRREHPTQAAALRTSRERRVTPER